MRDTLYHNTRNLKKTLQMESTKRTN